MKKYRCIKEFDIDLLGVNGFETGYYETIPVGSMWELDTEIDCGENHLESIDSSNHLAWVEIDDEDLKEYFEEA